MCYYVNIGNKATTRRVTRRMPIVEQELLTLPENLISYPIFSGVRIAQSLAFCVVFLLVLLSFFFWQLYCLSVLRFMGSSKDLYSISTIQILGFSLHFL